ncbi:MAG: ethanolamine ammonia-lyase reactivating factor EutA [Patescibacteria group bacterium]
MGLFSFLQSKKTDDENFLVLDIGSNTIRALIVKIEAENDKGYVVGYGHEGLPFNNISYRQITNISAVVNKAALAIEKAANLAGEKPINVVAGLSGPLLISGLGQAVHHRLKPAQKITPAELQTIFTQIQNQNKQEQIAKLAKNKTNYQIELVNAAITQVFIDDMPVENPINFIGREIVIKFYYSYAPLRQIGALQSVIDELKLNLVSVINESYAMSKAIDISHYQYHDSILIDIGGDTSNIACIQKGQLIFTACINTGCRCFIEALAKEMDISPAKADQYIKDYSDDLLADETKHQFNQLFHPVAQKWRDKLATELAKHDLTEYPRKIYIYGGGAMIPEIPQILSQPWSKPINFTNQPTVKMIHPIDIEKIVDKTTHIKNSLDINALSLATLGLKFSNADSPREKFIKRVMQTIRT